MDSFETNSPFGKTWRPRAPRRSDSDYEYVLDGDQWELVPGREISNIQNFRSRLSRMCQNRGLRYRTLVHEGSLWVEVFRERPGDLLPADLAGEPGYWPTAGAAGGPPEPSPGQ